MSAAGQLTPHFSKAELNYNAAPNATVRANLEALAGLLEDVRAVVGVPLRVTSGYRPAGTNAATAGASSSSQHLDGTAADVVPVGLSNVVAMQRLAASPLRSRWGQLIVYPYGTHLHVSLPTRGSNGAMLVQASADSAAPRYVPYSSATLATVADAAKGSATATAIVTLATVAGAGILARGA